MSKWVIYDRELDAYLRGTTTNIYGYQTQHAHKFNTKEEAKQFINNHPVEHFPDSEWHNKESRVPLEITE